MKALDKDKSGQVTFAEWQANAKSVKDIFKPGLELQAQMQKSFFGKSFWAKATKHRLA